MVRCNGWLNGLTLGLHGDCIGEQIVGSRRAD